MILLPSCLVMLSFLVITQDNGFESIKEPIRVVELSPTGKIQFSEGLVTSSIPPTLWVVWEMVDRYDTEIKQDDQEKVMDELKQFNVVQHQYRTGKLGIAELNTALAEMETRLKSILPQEFCFRAGLSKYRRRFYLDGPVELAVDADGGSTNIENIETAMMDSAPLLLKQMILAERKAVDAILADLPEGPRNRLSDALYSERFGSRVPSLATLYFGLEEFENLPFQEQVDLELIQRFDVGSNGQLKILSGNEHYRNWLVETIACCNQLGLLNTPPGQIAVADYVEQHLALERKGNDDRRALWTKTPKGIEEREIYRLEKVEPVAEKYSAMLKNLGDELLDKLTDAKQKRELEALRVVGLIVRCGPRKALLSEEFAKLLPGGLSKDQYESIRKKASAARAVLKKDCELIEQEFVSRIFSNQRMSQDMRMSLEWLNHDRLFSPVPLELLYFHCANLEN